MAVQDVLALPIPVLSPTVVLVQKPKSLTVASDAGGAGLAAVTAPREDVLEVA
ncbi:hypothetical protein [Mycolicibacterium goodii]|uniref:hypothetical protein n=1 Tax=Mycolicibacterium goodii TaxID=134601 RepID=UPI001BDD9644|nr:hypothetical protein [Mycolicibacterium goodii]MBU8832871.1 hypothetical protein [Mycolicibacterium goodii]